MISCCIRWGDRGICLHIIYEFHHQIQWKLNDWKNCHFASFKYFPTKNIFTRKWYVVGASLATVEIYTILCVDTAICEIGYCHIDTGDTWSWWPLLVTDHHIVSSPATIVPASVSASSMNLWVEEWKFSMLSVKKFRNVFEVWHLTATWKLK